MVKDLFFVLLVLKGSREKMNNEPNPEWWGHDNLDFLSEDIDEAVEDYFEDQQWEFNDMPKKITIRGFSAADDCQKEICSVEVDLESWIRSNRPEYLESFLEARTADPAVPH